MRAGRKSVENEPGRRILVVEDAEDLAIVLRDRFRREGCSVETVRDGESALRATEPNPPMT